ncbi:leucine-rich repeat and coiled-coil domain-containing protein 1 isoform 2-T2 [Mantella aurantiaca]
MADGITEAKELSLMDKHIRSLSDLNLNSFLQNINLHCNQISEIKGLAHLRNLQHLDLSANLISRIEGLDALIHLQSLNLACNKLTRIEGLHKLLNLRKLNLSYNRIHDLSGLIPLHGWNLKLSHLYLHSNCIDGMDHVLQSMVGLKSLAHLTLQQDGNGNGNPVCFAAGYRDVILGKLPVLQALDGVSRSGESVLGFGVHSGDVPNLDFLEYLITCDGEPVSNGFKDSTSGRVITPRIDQVLSQYHRRPVTSGSEYLSSCIDAMTSSEQDSTSMLREMRIKNLETQISELLKAPHPKSETAMKPKRDTDPTTESDFESEKENIKTSVTKRSKIPALKNSQTQKQKSHQQLKTRSLTSVSKQKAARKQKSPSPHRTSQRPRSASSDRANTDSTEHASAQLAGPSRSLQRRLEPSVSNSVEESTYRALVQELDQERERRWKAEQLVVKLTESIKALQSQAKEEKDINSLAVHATDRIKELLLKEKDAKCTLQVFVHQLKEENVSLSEKLKQSVSKEDEYRQALRKMEDAMSKLETQRIQQEALEMKHVQEAERRVNGFQREIELLRGSLRQQKGKVHQLHELLTSREQSHRMELEARVPLNGPEFQEAVDKELSREEQRHNQQMRDLQETIGKLTQQYCDLEDEFRAALVMEAGRFKEVKDGFDSVAADLAEHKEALSHVRLKEKQSANLVQELTTMVKEQKTRIADVTKSKQEIIKDLKTKIRSLEMVAGEEKQKTVQIQLLKQEKCKLISQLTAQESLIDGLKAERKIWGQELTQQGVSLAQDRGRLEAKIEVLSTEIESLKKQNERDNDTLRIKTKMVEDQTETIKKLKEGLQERDERIRKLHAENLEMEKALREQNDERAIQLHELKEKLERQMERKEEMKLQLEEKEAELEDVKKAYSAMNKKWQDKAELLSQLETQVRQMKENFDGKEKRLIEERDKSLQNQKFTR